MDIHNGLPVQVTREDSDSWTGLTPSVPTDADEFYGLTEDFESKFGSPQCFRWNKNGTKRLESERARTKHLKLQKKAEESKRTEEMTRKKSECDRLRHELEAVEAAIGEGASSKGIKRLKDPSSTGKAGKKVSAKDGKNATMAKKQPSDSEDSEKEGEVGSTLIMIA